MTEAGPAWSFKIEREAVPETGLHVDLSADEAVRAVLAKSANLLNLPRLAASFDLTRSGRNGLHVVGEVSSVVVQECVVTLEPIEQNLVEQVELTFVPEASEAASVTTAEASLAGDETDPPEVLIGGAADLGAIATEYFLLGIDPYPRKAGVMFQPPSAGESAVNPFAALEALKKPQRGDKG